jgi:predicted enzyme related to lactoylglutathione lyase
MEQITGIGGVFFRAKDLEALSTWYEDTFGISRAPRDYGTAPWMQQAGATVFAPFPSAIDYFGNPSQAWMINFHVANLDRVIAQLRAKGIAVALDPEIYPNGRFARLSDPEGNPIELWVPTRWLL